ncbi:MAG: alpha/beta fold hydrolase [Ardenticatenaceae bacterium]|nr:alpha/beta fold hydrolase [Anaerolineales bacterium]MCB8920612.1 alpha/beta fold hydrolase [Ardenticatenaceae bacterium]MCB8990236.1 alpha/beta fold hydrolase [Ardenticatenaceae bacterium]MCB9002972.1 alpha/beta fold hydrolase [Ardenticatenaceae bacterium]
MPFQPTYDVPPERQAYTIFAAPESGPERIGLLMLHGFMGSPVSSRPMAEFLAENGVTVHCPLLPGHGNLPHKIHNLSRHAWLAEAEEGLAFLRQHCNQIFIAGHSMGAVLGAHLALHNPDICGFIMLAPLYDLPDWRIKMVMFGRYFMKWFYPLKNKMTDRDIFLGRVLDYDPSIDPNDPELQDWLIEASRLPIDGLDEMRKMAVLGRKSWPKLHLPVIVFQGGSDPAVNAGNTEKLFQRLGTPDKEMKLFPQVGHELMRPVEPIHGKVWQKILVFIQDYSGIGGTGEKPILSGGSLLK